MSATVPARPAADRGKPAGEAPDDLLTVRGLRVSYSGAVRVLHDVSLAVPDGSVVALLGSNGAGKSTLLRAISGTLPLHGGRIDRGTVTFAGARLDRMNPASVVRAGLVQVPEGRRVFAGLTVDENLRAAAVATRGRDARASASARVFHLFPILRERRTQRAGLLSGGEQQMLAIGRALMADPRLLLLDEPSLGLAPRLVGQVAEVVREVHAQGTSVMLVEQNAAMALDVADVAYVMELGRVAADGPADELAASQEVRDRYLGVGAADRAAAAPPTRGARGRGATPRDGSSGTPGRLSVDCVSVRFGGVNALTDVSFDVEPGTVHAIIGPNGAGKSTCVNVLTGVYRSRTGSVRFGEHDLTGLRPFQIAHHGVTRTFQNLALSAGATVEDNLMLGRHRLTTAGLLATGLRLPGASREQRRERAHVREAAELVGLGDLLRVPVGSLSYGDRKRVELARALCAEPALLLLDEPVSGMNRAESQQMATVVRDVHAALGMSIVLIEHDMTFVMGLAAHVTVLDFGRRIADGTPQQVQSDPEVLRAYLGTADAPSPRTQSAQGGSPG